MALLEELVLIGYNQEEAQKLAGADSFHHRKKDREQLKDLFNEISGTYGCTFEEVKRAVLSFPPFAGLDHERVVRQGVEVYGSDNEDKVKRAVLSFPPFAGYDHERVVRQKTRLGRIVGLSNNESIDYLLEKPVWAGYSAKRYLAALDIGRQLEKERFTQNRKMLQTFLSNISKSPYVPNHNRKRISQVEREGITTYKEPPLMKVIRKRLS